MRKSTLPSIMPYKNSYRCSGTAELSDGTTERLQATAKTEAEAYEKWQQKIEARNYEIQYGRRKLEGKISLYDAINDKLQEFKTIPRDGRKGEILLRDSTLERMRQILENQIDRTAVSKKMVCEITPRDMAMWRIEMNTMKSRTGKPLSPSVKMRAYKLIQDVMEEYRLYDNPLDGFRTWHQKANKKTKENVLLPDEILCVELYCKEKMASPETKMDSTYAAVTLIMLYCYPRPGEVYGIQCRDWHPDSGMLEVHRTGNYEDGRLKNDDSYREIFPPNVAAEILNGRCSGLRGDDKIFPALNGGLISDGAYRQWLLKMLKQLGIVKESFSPHKMRGTGISYALYLKVPLEIVSKNAGHSDISTTLNWYASTYKEQQIEAARDYSNALEARR